jgi:hypothetical protein
MTNIAMRMVMVVVVLGGHVPIIIGVCEEVEEGLMTQSLIAVMATTIGRQGVGAAAVMVVLLVLVARCVCRRRYNRTRHVPLESPAPPAACTARGAPLLINAARERVRIMMAAQICAACPLEAAERAATRMMIASIVMRMGG